MSHLDYFFCVRTTLMSPLAYCFCIRTTVMSSPGVLFLCQDHHVLTKPSPNSFGILYTGIFSSGMPMTTYESLSHLSANLCLPRKPTLRIRNDDLLYQELNSGLKIIIGHSFAHFYLIPLQLFNTQNRPFSLILWHSVPLKK